MVEMGCAWITSLLMALSSSHRRLVVSSTRSSTSHSRRFMFSRCLASLWASLASKVRCIMRPLETNLSMADRASTSEKGTEMLGHEEAVLCIKKGQVALDLHW